MTEHKKHFKQENIIKQGDIIKFANGSEVSVHFLSYGIPVGTIYFVDINTGHDAYLAV